jgi:hypothetical protein
MIQKDGNIVTFMNIAAHPVRLTPQKDAASRGELDPKRLKMRVCIFMILEPSEGILELPMLLSLRKSWLQWVLR